jgi:polyisoprenoid-binding protein YceI
MAPPRNGRRLFFLKADGAELVIRKTFVLAVASVAVAGCNAPVQKAAVAPAQEAPVAIIAPAGEYVLDKDHAALLWTVNHMGISNYTQRFLSYDATLSLDPSNIENSKISVQIDPASIQADYADDYRKTHAKMPWKSWTDQLANDPQFMNAKQFPAITFASTKVERTGPKTAKVTGDLTFLGVTRPVTLNATLIGQTAKQPFLGVGAIGIDAEGAFSGADFGMKMPLAKVVKINFAGEFHQKVNAPPGAPPPKG